LKVLCSRGEYCNQPRHTDALSLRSLYLYFLSEEAIGDVTNISLCVTSALKR